MKYIIEVPDEIAVISQEFLVKAGLLCEPYTDDRKAIEDEVWEFLAFLIDEMDVDDKYECFGMSSAYKIVSNMSYNEAKARYEAWKKQKDEIHVGDEVKDHEDIKAVVLDICMDGEAYVVYTENRICEDWLKDEGFVKTGRHFPEVAQLLEKMRGEEE